MAYFQEELFEPCIDDGGTPNGAIRREGPIDITRVQTGRGGVVPTLKKAENKSLYRLHESGGLARASCRLQGTRR